MAQAGCLVSFDHFETKGIDEWIVSIEQVLGIKLLKWAMAGVLLRPTAIDLVVQKSYPAQNEKAFDLTQRTKVNGTYSSLPHPTIPAGTWISLLKYWREFLMIFCRTP